MRNSLLRRITTFSNFMEVVDSLEHRNFAAVPGDRQFLYTVATRPCHWINIVRILTYVSNATDN